MTIRIAHISDTHIGESRPVFNGNFERLAEALRADRPDILINTGDLSLDGADHEADLRRAKVMHEAVGLPWRAIPGNHDIGDSEGIGSARPIDETRRRRYLDVFGEDWWSEDFPGWRLIAVDAQLAGSSLAEAQAQAAFVREAAASAGGRAIALFVHKPLFERSADEAAVGGRFSAADSTSGPDAVPGRHRPAVGGERARASSARDSCSRRTPCLGTLHCVRFARVHAADLWPQGRRLYRASAACRRKLRHSTGRGAGRHDAARSCRRPGSLRRRPGAKALSIGKGRLHHLR
jgi:hypothetical protein